MSDELDDAIVEMSAAPSWVAAYVAAMTLSACDAVVEAYAEAGVELATHVASDAADFIRDRFLSAYDEYRMTMDWEPRPKCVGEVV